MNRLLSLPALVLVAVLAPFVSSLRALQQSDPQRPVFRSGVELVQIDVVVLDENGRPVRGLTQDDFRLYDRGVQQAIATFAARTHDSAPTGLLPPGLPSDVADNRSAKSDRLVMLVLDDLHFRGRTAEAAALVRRVISEIGDSVSMGLVTTSGTFGVEVTEDRERLLRALDTFVDRYDPARAPIPRVQSPSPEVQIRPHRPADLAGSFATFHAYKTVEDVARMAGANDGRRKAFIWISAGLAGALRYRDACEGLAGDDHTSESLCGMFDKLHRSSVAVYPVSPGGPTDGGGSLTNIATDTGGFAIRASELDVGMTRLLADLDNYYLLGFYPSERGRKGYREVEVQVTRPGLTVRHRLGYHAAGPPPPPKNENPLDALVAPIIPRSDLHLRLGAVPFYRKNGSPQLLATLEVDLGAIPAVDAAGLARDELQFAVYAVNLNKKKVVRAAGRRILIDWPPDDRTRPGAQRFVVQTVLPCPPGPYQIRASAMSKALSKSGSVYLQTDVPKIGEAPLGLSGLAVTSGDAGSPRLVESKPLALVVPPFAPSLDREFHRAATLQVFFQLVRKNQLSPVEGVARLVDDTGREAARLPWSLASSIANSVALQLPLAGVAPGPYRLVVSAAGTDGVSSETQIGLRIVP